MDLWIRRRRQLKRGKLAKPDAPHTCPVDATAIARLTVNNSAAERAG
ncbi:hypothetical protein [Paracoccus beibuensis]|nr:hypothetical protein [Paracoccus beibuensis]